MRLLFLILPFYLLSGELNIKTQAPYVCVMNQKTGKLIYGKNIHKKIYPASITKLAVILYLIEECEIEEKKLIHCQKEHLLVVSEKDKLNSNYTLPPYILEDDGVSLDLQIGEKIPLGSLIRAALIRSANDAANVLAGTYANSISEFMFELNKYLRKIGCKNTHFVNPHGLHHPDHYTTAYDLAIIMKRAGCHSQLKKLLSITNYEIEKTNKSPLRTIKNTNFLIRSDSKYYLPSVIGGKTGYHRRAKYNIAALAEENDRCIITIVNKAETSIRRFEDCRKIFSEVFSEEMKERILFNAKESKFNHKYYWADKIVEGVLYSDSILQYYPSEEEDIEVKVYWHDLTSPIKKGDIIANIDIYNPSGIPLQQHNIYASEDVGYKILYRVRICINFMIKFVYNHPLGTFSALFFMFYILPRRRKKVV